MRYFIFLALLFSIILTKAQTKSYLDSIANQELSLSNIDFAKLVADIPYDKALQNKELFFQLSEKAVSISTKENNNELLARSFTQLALAYYFSSKPDLSVEFNIKAAGLFKKNNDLESYARCYLNLGW